jgi:hypothetical protein
VEIDRRCRDAYCLYHQRDRRPDDGGSKHLWDVVSFYETTRRNIPEDSHFHDLNDFTHFIRWRWKFVLPCYVSTAE